MDNHLYKELKENLPQSTRKARKAWAKRFAREEISVHQLIPLLEEGEPLSKQVIWFLSDMAEADPIRFKQDLPYLLLVLKPENNLQRAVSFVNYWLIAGVPEENEAQAINILIDFLKNSEANITLKSRSALVLLKMCKKYPEIKNELKLILEPLKERYSADFKKKAERILSHLDAIK